MRGDFANLSERKLMDCLTRLGYDIDIKVRPSKAPIGSLRLAAGDWMRQVFLIATSAPRRARMIGASPPPPRSAVICTSVPVVNRDLDSSVLAAWTPARQGHQFAPPISSIVPSKSRRVAI
jgi:hypothetical protein